jgi:hypothetical protein
VRFDAELAQREPSNGDAALYAARDAIEDVEERTWASTLQRAANPR